MKLEDFSEKLDSTFNEVVRMGKEIGVKTAVVLVPGLVIHEASLIYDVLYTQTLSPDALAQYQAAGELYMNELREAVQGKHDVVAWMTNLKDLWDDKVPFVSREGQMIGQGMMLASPVMAISSALFNKLDDVVKALDNHFDSPGRRM